MQQLQFYVQNQVVLISSVLNLHMDFFSATAPQCQTNDRVECGYFGINKVDCDSRGCCYSPTTAGGQPWCYHETGKPGHETMGNVT